VASGQKAAGYSGKSLADKLGVKPGLTFEVVNDPAGDYHQALGFKPDRHAGKSGRDMLHFFTKEKAELAKTLPKLMKAIQPAGAIWVSWPKKASGVATDITEDTIRAIARPLGLVDIKVCAVTEVWSGLKLVIRKENR
jgi:hypothetical protein